MLDKDDPTRTAFPPLCPHLKMPTGNRYRMQMEAHYWASAQGERRDTQCKGISAGRGVTIVESYCGGE
ncbi:hypothetical protein Aduo_019148 [Ancylostoma duodenale]